MPAYPIPATLIAKLAVDNPVKGQGLGGELLAHALYRIVRASQEIGIFAVRVDAIALQAKKFYSNTSLFPFKIKNYPFFKPAFGAETLRVRVGVSLICFGELRTDIDCQPPVPYRYIPLAVRREPEHRVF
jgi:hypothetical protein